MPLSPPSASPTGLGSFLVQFKKALENFLFGRIAVSRVRIFRLGAVGQFLGPAIGGGHGAVEIAMGVRQPRRPLVVEIGERALLQLLGGVQALRYDAVGIARYNF